MILSLCINELLLELEPEELLVSGNGIGHEIFAIDRCGGNRIAVPVRGSKIGGRFQIIAGNI
jgi:hypothetical protein